ncbi:unnamed protein product [Rotaria magnacalcarata]|uniref:Uncharacterized protein n=1 Tax=Rotaria magnacalcarata TaxID=392030 RepID=A0A8S2LTP1_9BILA|nr:unnamed protein product [Rotaria magnacalcarata]
MDASNNNDAPVTNENSATSEMSTLKLTIETPKDEKDMLIDASSTVKQNVGARICARVFGEEKVINNDIEEFTYSAITSLRTSLNLNGLLLFDSCMESNIEPDPREIHINGEWNYQALKASLEDPPQYRLHVLLGTIKLLDEFFHCLTTSFINYRNEH